MKKKYVLSKRRAISLLAFVMFFSISVGFFTAKGIALGPKTKEASVNSADYIQKFIEEEVEKNRNLKLIEKEAKKIGKKQGLIVAFVDSENYNTKKVNIMLDLGNKYPMISSFEVQEVSKVDY